MVCEARSQLARSGKCFVLYRDAVLYDLSDEQPCRHTWTTRPARSGSEDEEGNTKEEKAHPRRGTSRYDLNYEQPRDYSRRTWPAGRSVEDKDRSARKEE